MESNHCLHEPTIIGNGEITLKQWEGFWTSTRRFKLTGEPKRLEPVPQRFYELNVKGVASNRFPLYAQESKEPTVYVDAGRHLSIKRFDTQTEKYLIVVDSRTKGWAQVNPENVRGLPWAD